MSSRYIPHTEADIAQMLDAINVDSIEALFEPIPEKLRLARPLHIPASASEQEVSRELGRLAAKNEPESAAAIGPCQGARCQQKRGD